ADRPVRRSPRLRARGGGLRRPHPPHRPPGRAAGLRRLPGRRRGHRRLRGVRRAARAAPARPHRRGAAGRHRPVRAAAADDGGLHRRLRRHRGPARAAGQREPAHQPEQPLPHPRRALARAARVDRADVAAADRGHGRAGPRRPRHADRAPGAPRGDRGPGRGVRRRPRPGAVAGAAGRARGRGRAGELGGRRLRRPAHPRPRVGRRAHRRPHGPLPPRAGPGGSVLRVRGRDHAPRARPRRAHRGGAAGAGRAVRGEDRRPAPPRRGVTREEPSMTMAYVSIIVLVILFAATLLPAFDLGLAAFAAAFLDGLAAGVPAAELTGFFPAACFALIVGVTAPFAVAHVNGTLDWLLDLLLRLVRGRLVLVALVPFVVGAVLTAVGTLPAAATAIVAPIALGLAARHRISPFVAAVLGVTGIVSGLL